MKLRCGAKNVEPNARAKTLKELISAMEQFYSGLLSVGDAARVNRTISHWSLLCLQTVPNCSSMPQYRTASVIFLKNSCSPYFPDAHLVPQPYDYNVFARGGTSLASVAHFTDNPVLPAQGLHRLRSRSSERDTQCIL